MLLKSLKFLVNKLNSVGIKTNDIEPEKNTNSARIMYLLVENISQSRNRSKTFIINALQYIRQKNFTISTFL